MIADVAIPVLRKIWKHGAAHDAVPLTVRGDLSLPMKALAL